MKIQKKKKEKIKEPFASQLRAALWRARTHNYSEEDLIQMKRTKEILSQYTAVWK